MLAHGLRVGVAPGATESCSALEVRDPAVAEVDEVMHRERQAVVVGGANDVDVRIVDVPSQDDEGDLPAINGSATGGPSMTSASNLRS